MYVFGQFWPLYHKPKNLIYTHTPGQRSQLVCVRIGALQLERFSRGVRSRELGVCCNTFVCDCNTFLPISPLCDYHIRVILLSNSNTHRRKFCTHSKFTVTVAVTLVFIRFSKMIHQNNRKNQYYIKKYISNFLVWDKRAKIDQKHTYGRGAVFRPDN